MPVTPWLWGDNCVVQSRYGVSKLNQSA